MSWKYYEVLSIQPNFENPPDIGIVSAGRALTEISSAPAFVVWEGDTPLSFRFDFRLGRVEADAFRLFLKRTGGKSTPFFLPTWRPDFKLAADVAAGASTIRIQAAGLSLITANRPDTEGRNLFIALPDGSFQAVRWLSALLTGTEEILTLESPIAFNIDASVAMIGRLYFVRLAEDMTAMIYDVPGLASSTLAMVTARATRHAFGFVDIQTSEIYSLYGFTKIITTDEDPILDVYNVPTSIGRPVGGQSVWTGSFTAGNFRLKPTSGSARISTLFDGTVAPDHWAFGFDAADKEFVAWTTPAGKVRVGRFSGATPVRIEFDGYSPATFSTYGLNEDVGPSDVDLVIFYLRKGFSTIFARFYRENFSIEHKLIPSPVAPIYLHLARKTDLGDIEILGMDAGHRRTIWKAEPNIFIGLTIAVRYSNTDGPVPGGHGCDAAIYKVEGNGILIGIANLNNKIDGGDRETILTVTAEQSETIAAASEELGRIDLSLICDPTQPGFDLVEFGGSCHVGLAWVIVTNDNGDELYNGAPEGNFVSINVLA